MRADFLRMRPEFFRNQAEMIRTDAEQVNTQADKAGNKTEEKGVEVMPTKLNPEKVQTDSDTILGVWKANTDFKMKEVTLEDFEAETKRLDAVLKEINAKELELTPLRNERDDLSLKLNEICTRARSGMKGFFGPNSSQYEQAGGTRAVERKKPQRRNNAEPEAKN